MFRRWLILGVVSASSIFGVFAAKSYKSSGTAYQVVLSEENAELADGRSVVTTRAKHLWVIEKVDPNYPLPRKGTCTTVGTVIFEADGKTWSGAQVEHCQDEDGDSYWLAGEGDQSGGTFHQLRGTGKYHGLKSEGTWKPGIEFMNNTSISTWEATETLP